LRVRGEILGPSRPRRDPDGRAEADGAALETPPLAQPSIRRTEVPFGPFLAASALGYLFLHRQVWLFIERAVLGG
jgi:hypothetical protein